MRIINLTIIILFFSTLLVIFFTYNQETKNRENIIRTVAKDHLLCHELFEDVFLQIDEAIKTAEDEFYKNIKTENIYMLKSCPFIISDFKKYKDEVTLILEFGKKNCNGLNQKKLKGNIICTLSNKYAQENSLIEVFFNDFYIDNYKIDGNFIIENTGLNNNNNLTYRINIENGVIITPLQKTLRITAIYTREWTQGRDTPFLRTDDEYLISGLAQGVSSTGENYISEIISPIKTSINSKNIEKGKIKTSLSKQENVSISFNKNEKYSFKFSISAK